MNCDNILGLVLIEINEVMLQNPWTGSKTSITEIVYNFDLLGYQ